MPEIVKSAFDASNPGIETKTFPSPGSLLPHGQPILQIDAITAYEPGQYLIAEKKIGDDNPFLQGHFPGYPLMPGVILIEMMFQSCGLYGRMEDLQTVRAEGMLVKKMGKAIKINNAIFKEEVRPGVMLHIRVDFKYRVAAFSIFEASITEASTGPAIREFAKAQITVHL